MPRGVAVTDKRKDQSVSLASPLSGVYERDAYQWDAIGGSERLKDAIGAAVMRYAAANRMSIAEAAALLIGTEPSRLSQPVRLRTADYTGHRPSEIIARPIGEILEPIVSRTIARGIAG